MNFSRTLKKGLLTTAAVLLIAAQASWIADNHASAALGPNLISNPSFEVAAPASSTLPLDWTSNKWGTNSTTFTYKSNSARTGTKSALVKMTSRSSGDAKWMHKAVAVQPNTSYTFSDYYKANVASSLIAEIGTGTSAYSYVTIANPTASASVWKQATATLTTPANAKTVTIFHIINKVGTLEIDDASFGLTNYAPPAPTPTPPTATITAPSNNTTVNGIVNVTATAGGDSSISGVQFKVNNVNIGAEDTIAPYAVDWNTTTYPNTTHTITVVARNTQALATTSVPVTVTVNNIVTPAPPTPPVDSANLIPNPSAETAETGNTQKPVDWSNGSWGTNTPTYSYVNEGHSGTKSVRTTVSNYSSGDAKWYFNPVTVNPDKSYDYNHYYKSNTTTDILAQFTDAGGTNSYKWLGTVAPSTIWQLFSSSFITPAAATKVTVLHIVYSNGWLQLDDISLKATAPPIVDNGTPSNGSLERAISNNPSLPDLWTKSSWGTNTPTFEYVNEGHTGNRSVKTTISNYVDGDAKWYFNPITTLERGKQYRFNTWYKTNTLPKVVAMFEKDNGTTTYFGLPNPQPNGSANWQNYSDTFSVPGDAKSVSVFMFIDKNGWVQVDDQTITPYLPTGFNRPLLTLTFDDGHEDNVANALPLLNSYGIKTTQCYATDHVEGIQQGIDGVMAFHNSGHEICSHTVSHPFLTTLTPTQLVFELQHSKQVLETVTGQPVHNFASPYGDYNQSVNNEIKNYYRSHRTVDEGYNSKDNFDAYRLRVQNVFNTTTTGELQAWINQAKATNTWLILVYHRVANDAGRYDSYPADFAAQLGVINQSGITVKTYNDALGEVVPQL